MKKKSWRTTLLGILLSIAGFLALAGPEKWRPVFGAVTVAAGGGGLMAAKDDSKD